MEVTASAASLVWTGIRLILLGKTGSGKSMTGNRLLGEEKFETHKGLGLSSLTRHCKVEKGMINSTTIYVMDTPGLFDTRMTQLEVAKEIIGSIASWTPGPHALLYVIPCHRAFTEEDYAAFSRLKALFGEDALRFTIVVFTHGDILQKYSSVPPEVFLLEKAPSEFKQLLRECANRYVVFNNMSEDKTDVVRLLEMVRELHAQNNWQVFPGIAYLRTRGDPGTKLMKRLSDLEEEEMKTERETWSK